MKWKKREKSLETMGRDGEDVPVNEFASRPFRTPYT